MKKIALTLIIITSIAANARNTSSIKALFIYQFTRMIEWPIETKKGMFRIGVLGSFDMYKEISDATLGRNVGVQNIEVMNIMDISQLNLTNYHILVIGDNLCNQYRINEINAKLKGTSTITITLKDNYLNNKIAIGFKKEGEQFSYCYSLLLIKNKGLQISKDFISLGEKFQ